MQTLLLVDHVARDIRMQIDQMKSKRSLDSIFQAFFVIVIIKQKINDIMPKIIFCSKTENITEKPEDKDEWDETGLLSIRKINI